MNTQMVIARYNEDVSWLKNYENVIIYNKGEKFKVNIKFLNYLILEEKHIQFSIIYFLIMKI